MKYLLNTIFNRFSRLAFGWALGFFINKFLLLFFQRAERRRRRRQEKTESVETELRKTELRKDAERKKRWLSFFLFSFSFFLTSLSLTVTLSISFSLSLSFPLPLSLPLSAFLGFIPKRINPVGFFAFFKSYRHYAFLPLFSAPAPILYHKHYCHTMTRTDRCWQGR